VETVNEQNACKIALIRLTDDLVALSATTNQGGWRLEDELVEIAKTS
jgi:hypothetical protein